MARAWLSAFGIPANAPKDAVHPVGLTDADGEPLDASKHDLPPASGFWSLTMYDEGYFFIPNPLNRYALSARDQLAVNADGSVDLYWPKETPPSVLDGSWWPPVIAKAG